jgi:hypothetical protein
VTARAEPPAVLKLVVLVGVRLTKEVGGGLH